MCKTTMLFMQCPIWPIDILATLLVRQDSQITHSQLRDKDIRQNEEVWNSQGHFQSVIELLQAGCVLTRILY